MRKLASVCLLVACAVLFAGCTPADPKEVPKSAEGVFSSLKDRKYDDVYDDASDAFKKTYQKQEFVDKMKELEGFGQLLEVKADGQPTVEESDGDKIARAPYAARFALAQGPFSLTLRGNDITGKWELDGYKYDVTATTSDPPYTPNETGAEKLAQRFLYLWQNRRYDDLSTVMQLQDEPQKIQDFFKKLESAGKLLTMERTLYEPSTERGAKAVATDYDLKFDNGTGTMNFKLLEVGGQWRLDSVKYNIEYNTPKP